MRIDRYLVVGDFAALYVQGNQPPNVWHILNKDDWFLCRKTNQEQLTSWEKVSGRSSLKYQAYISANTPQSHLQVQPSQHRFTLWCFSNRSPQTRFFDVEYPSGRSWSILNEFVLVSRQCNNKLNHTTHRPHRLSYLSAFESPPLRSLSISAAQKSTNTPIHIKRIIHTHSILWLRFHQANRRTQTVYPAGWCTHKPCNKRTSKRLAQCAFDHSFPPMRVVDIDWYKDFVLLGYLNLDGWNGSATTTIRQLTRKFSHSPSLTTSSPRCTHRYWASRKRIWFRTNSWASKEMALNNSNDSRVVEERFGVFGVWSDELPVTIQQHVAEEVHHLNNSQPLRWE